MLRLLVFKCLSRANVCYAVHVVYMCECVSFNYACVLKTSFRSPQYISPLKMRNFLDWWRSIFQSTVSLPSFWNIDLMSKGIFLASFIKKVFASKSSFFHVILSVIFQDKKNLVSCCPFKGHAK